MSLLSDYKALTMTNRDRILWAQKSPDEILSDVDDFIVSDGVTAIEDRRAVFKMLDLDFSGIEARAMELGAYAQRVMAGVDFGSGDEAALMVYMGGRCVGKALRRGDIFRMSLEMCPLQMRERIEALLKQETREISVGYEILAHDEADKYLTAAKPAPIKPKGAQWKRERRSFGRSCK